MIKNKNFIIYMFIFKILLLVLKYLLVTNLR
jgi:hypothetical protein